MKTVVIYHSVDLDGWMSAAIVKHWFKENNKSNGELINPLIFKDGKQDTLIASTGTLDFLGYTYGDPIPDLLEYDKVIMCDISFPKDEMYKLWHQLDKHIIWIDHHISAIKDNNDLVWGGTTGCKYGIQDSKFAACELTWKFFFPNETMPEIVRLLGMYDNFRHKGTDEEKKVLEFQYGARSLINNYETAYKYLTESINADYDMVHSESIESIVHTAGIYIYNYLSLQAKDEYAKGFIVHLLEATNDTVLRRKFICINKERFNPINFGINYHEDGYDGAICFHYANNMWNFSIYNDNGIVDCSSIAKSFGGGGHRGASGFRIGDINVFLQNYKQY